MWRPENKALRALLWLVIVLVPGGFILFGLLAAEAVQRRIRESAAMPTAELADVPLSGLDSSAT